MVPVGDGDGILLDLRYATAGNLTGRPIYARPVALLRPEAHAGLLAAAARAAVLGLRLKLFDAFRPLGVKVLAGAPVPEQALTAADYAEMAQAGIRWLGEIGLGSVRDPDEAAQHAQWARSAGLNSIGPASDKSPERPARRRGRRGGRGRRRKTETGDGES